MSAEVMVKTLAPGDGFELVLDTTGRRRPGYVVAVNSGSASVMLLDKTTRTFRTQEGSDVEIASVAGLQHWCLEALVVPTGKKHAAEVRETKSKGEAVMPKSKKNTDEDRSTTLEIDVARARAFEDGKFVKKDESGKLNHTQIGFIIRVMLEEKKMSKKDLAVAIVKAGFETREKRSTPPRINTAVTKLLGAKVLSKSKTTEAHNAP